MRVSWKLIGKVGVSVLLFVFFLAWVDAAKTFSKIPSLHLGWFFSGLAVLILSQFFKSVRFGYLANRARVPFNFLVNFLIHNIVTSFGLVTPAKLGEGGKLYYYKDADKRELGFCFIIEKFSDFVVLFLFSLFVLVPIDNWMLSLFIITLLIIGGVLGIIFIDPISSFLFPRKFEKGWLSELKSKFTFKTFLIVAAQSLLVWFTVFLMQYLLARSAGLVLPFWQFSTVIAAAILIGFLSGLPGGIGSRELTLTFLFTTLFYAPKEVVGVFVIVNLFAQYTMFGIMAIVSYSLLRKRQEQR